MNLKGLVCRELGEGFTEKELAAAVGVSPRTIMKILADRLPKEPAIWKKVANISGWMQIFFGSAVW